MWNDRCSDVGLGLCRQPTSREKSAASPAHCRLFGRKVKPDPFAAGFVAALVMAVAPPTEARVQ